MCGYGTILRIAKQLIADDSVAVLEVALADATFGERLAEARRIKGETIEEVSDRLRIRPSIIQALETNNFPYMPHKGYTRNMVSSYARYLGLDSTRITEQFLREFHRYESSGGAGLVVPPRGYGHVNHDWDGSDTGETSGVRGVPTRRLAGNPVLGRAAGRGVKNAGHGNVGHVPDGIPSAGAPSATAAAGLGRQRYQHPDDREIITIAKRNQASGSYWGSGDNSSADKQFQSHLRQVQDDLPHYARSRRSGLNGRRASLSPSRQAQSTRKTQSSRQVRMNDYVGKPPKRLSGGRLTSSLAGHPALIIVGMVAAFLLLLILWALIASSCSKQETDNQPVTRASSTDNGITDAEIGVNLPSIESQIAEDGRYGPFDLTVKVEGGNSWLQITVDGAIVIEEVCVAPWENSYTVSSRCQVEAGAPGYVTLLRNGVGVELAVENGLGVAELVAEQRPIVQNIQDAG
jgi:hypothetical protein